MSPQLISRSGGGPVPYSYTLAATEHLSPQMIVAEFYSNNGSGPYIPCLSFYAQNGTLLGRYPAPQQIAGRNSAFVSWGLGVQAVADPHGDSNWSDELAGANGVAVGANYVVDFGGGQSYSYVREWTAIAVNMDVSVGAVDCRIVWALSSSAFQTQTSTATFSHPLGHPKTYVILAQGGAIDSVTFAETVPASGAILTFGILGTNQAPGTYGA